MIVLKLQFAVVDMARGVAAGLLFEALFEFGGEVYARLVGEADEYPQYIGHLFAQVGLFARLEALVAIGACHDACQFAHLFGEASHIGELREVAHSILPYPFVYSSLCFLYSHNQWVRRYAAIMPKSVSAMMR